VPKKLTEDQIIGSSRAR